MFLPLEIKGYHRITSFLYFIFRPLTENRFGGLVVLISFLIGLIFLSDPDGVFKDYFQSEEASGVPITTYLSQIQFYLFKFFSFWPLYGVIIMVVYINRPGRLFLEQLSQKMAKGLEAESMFYKELSQFEIVLGSLKKLFVPSLHSFEYTPEIDEILETFEPKSSFSLWEAVVQKKDKYLLLQPFIKNTRGNSQFRDFYVVSKKKTNLPSFTIRKRRNMLDRNLIHNFSLDKGLFDETYIVTTNQADIIRNFINNNKVLITQYLEDNDQIHCAGGWLFFMNRAEEDFFAFPIPDYSNLNFDGMFLMIEDGPFRPKFEAAIQQNKNDLYRVENDVDRFMKAVKI